MANPHDSTPPAAATKPAGIETLPPAPPAVKLPPQPRPDLTPEEQSRATGRLDAALVALVVVLAFLLGSFAVRNSDFWMHLASGRAIAQKQYAPWSGHDPFSYTTAGTYWTNHNWLYDLELYSLYVLLDGPGLFGPAVVVLKALLVVALAVVLLRTRRPGLSVWVPAACTGLALLAMSPRLQLQPVVFSLLFLGLTLWYLEATGREAEPGQPGGRRVGVWWLPLLFVLWANTDGWFLVGLLAVALYLVGEVLQGLLGPAREAGAAGGGRVRRLAMLLAVCAAACLLNPNTYHVFLDWPAELSFASPIPLLAQDSEFRSAFLSPLDLLPKQGGAAGPGSAYLVAVLAFFGLALLGVVSFAVNRRGWRWSRALTWLAFLALALGRFPAVAFFAVVAGPITALNFQDALALRRRDEAEPARAAPTWGAVVWAAWLAVVPVVLFKLLTLSEFWLWFKTADYPAQLGVPAVPWPFLVFAAVVLGLFFYTLGAVLPVLDRAFTDWSLGGRLLTALAGVGLLVVAWPGWLQGAWNDPYRARHAAWSLEPDPSFTQVAQFLGRLRQEGKLQGDEHGFALPPQAVNYFAWYCPQETGFFDPRFTLFPKTAQTFLDLRDALRVPETGKEGAQVPPWPQDPQAAARLREAFRQHHVTHVVLGEHNAAAALRRVGPLWNNPDEWALIYLDGRTAVFGWRDPQAPKAEAARWEALRYSPDRLAFGRVPDADRAPEQGPPPAKHFAALTNYMEASAPRSLPLDEATLDLALFDAGKGVWQTENLRKWVIGYTGGMVGSSCPAGGPVAVTTLLAYRTCLTGAMLKPPDPNAPQRPEWVDRLLLAMQRDHVVRHDSGPPAFPLLAVRAARRAVAQAPRDPLTALALAQAYRTLHFETRELVYSAEQLRALSFVRHVQMVGALSRALDEDPDLAPAHTELAERYLNFGQYGPKGFLDSALRHEREQLRLFKNAGRAAQQPEADFKHQVEEMERAVKRLQQEVSDKQNQYEVQAVNKPVLEKAQLALRLGLADQALDVLLGSEVLLFGQQGAQLELELLLCTGRTADVRRILTDPSGDMEKLGLATISQDTQVPAYDWYRLLLAAAEGDYGQVDERFEGLLKLPSERLEREGRVGLAEAVAANLLNVPGTETPATPFLAELWRTKAMQSLLLVDLAAREEADLQILRGLFALEAGDTERARACMRRVTSLAAPPGRYLPYLSLLGATSPVSAAALAGPSDFAARGPDLDIPSREAAAHYLNLMDAAAPR